jgi:hypothetical protein
MFATTQAVCGAVFGTGRGDWALLAMPLAPAAVLADGVTAAAVQVRQGWSWLRKAAARVLRNAAERLDPAPRGVPVPVVEAVEVPELRPVAVPVEAVPEAPVILPAAAPVLVQAAAAQVTAAPAADVVDATRDRLHEAVSRLGIRGAARELGYSEATCRRLCKSWGIVSPKARRRS